jgi:hypothetical protein
MNCQESTINGVGANSRVLVFDRLKVLMTIKEGGVFNAAVLSTKKSKIKAVEGHHLVQESPRGRASHKNTR